MAGSFHIVDVFAERPCAGNPLAVVVAPAAMADDAMLRIPAETNYSETTFVTPQPERDGGRRVRIFTPAREIAFAGHPILGTAWVVRRHLEHAASGPVLLDLAVGQVPVTFESSPGEADVGWFVAPPVSLGPTCPRERIAPALGLAADDIDASAPVQRCSAGTAAMIVPLRSLDALRRSRLDLAAYAPLAEDGLPPLVYLFCAETRRPENDLSARFFFDANGVREDPATGNGAAFLGAYLLAHRLRSRPEVSLRIEQGHELGRPSLVLLRARDVDGVEVRVGGGVVPIVEGRLL